MGSTLELGLVVRPHGVKGAVRVHLHNPASTALDGLRQVIVVQGGEQRSMSFRQLGDPSGGGAVVLELDGVGDRDAAEALRGARLLVERAALPALEEGEYYYEDLLGCRVEDLEGKSLGEVREVFSAGASDVLVVRQGGEERLIPLVDEWVGEVDLEGKRIRVSGAEQFEPTKV
jgi:16S rRNA processing protein RimM